MAAEQAPSGGEQQEPVMTDQEWLASLPTIEVPQADSEPQVEDVQLPEDGTL